MKIEDMITTYKQQNNSMLAFEDYENNFYICLKEKRDEFQRYAFAIMPRNE